MKRIASLFALVLCSACTTTAPLSQLCAEGATTFVLNPQGERAGMVGQSNPLQLNIKHGCATPEFEFTSPWEDLVEYQGAGSFRFLRPGWFKGQFKNGTQRKPQVLLAWAAPDAQKVKPLDPAFLWYSRDPKDPTFQSFSIRRMKAGGTLFPGKAEFLQWREAQLLANNAPPSQKDLELPEGEGSILLVATREDRHDYPPVVTHLEEAGGKRLHVAQPSAESVTELIPLGAPSEGAYLFLLPWKLEADTPVAYHQKDGALTLSPP